MRRSEKIGVTLDRQLVLVALTPEERRAIQEYADAEGLRLGTALASICAAAGRDPHRAAERAGLTLTAWVRDIALHAVGYLPSEALSRQRGRAEAYVRRGGE